MGFWFGFALFGRLLSKGDLHFKKANGFVQAQAPSYPKGLPTPHPADRTSQVSTALCLCYRLAALGSWLPSELKLRKGGQQKTKQTKQNKTPATIDPSGGWRKRTGVPAWGLVLLNYHQIRLSAGVSKQLIVGVVLCCFKVLMERNKGTGFHSPPRPPNLPPVLLLSCRKLLAPETY